MDFKTTSPQKMLPHAKKVTAFWVKASKKAIQNAKNVKKKYFLN